MGLFADRVNLIDSENAFKIGPYIQETEKATGKRVIKCNLGEPDFPTPKHICEEIKRQVDLDNMHYCDPQGIISLRKAIANHISESRQINVEPERVVVFPGAKPPIPLCQQTYANPGDEIVYPSPGFPIYESITRYVGAVPVPIHLKEEKGFSLGAEDIEPLISKKTKLIILNFPSNPTGGVATQKQFEAIAELIHKKAPDDVRVYSDEVYEDILFDGSKHCSIASIPGMEKKTIIISGVSKSYSWTGGRLGWAIFPTIEEALVFKNLNINYFSCLPPYNQEGARLALESPESNVSIRQMVAAFQERRDVVVAGLNEIPGITCQNPKGAFYVFPNISGVCEKIGALDLYESLPEETQRKTSPSTLFQMFLLFKYCVATMDRKSFGQIGSKGKHFLRLSIATGMDDLKEALIRIRAASEDKDGFHEFVMEGKRLS